MVFACGFPGPQNEMKRVAERQLACTSMQPFDVLLLDFGGVCLKNPAEMHAVAEGKLGLPAGTFQWLGPVDPSTDPLYREMTMGDTLREREYWTMRADEVGAAAGIALSLPEYIELLFDPPSPDMIRQEATATVTAARHAGIGVSVLTNDLRSFHGREWEHEVDFLRLIDHLVDCSDTGILKPDPRAFKRALGNIDVDPGRVLFVDDQALSVEAARQVGLDAMWFDISQASQSWQQVASALGLS